MPLSCMQRGYYLPDVLGGVKVQDSTRTVECGEAHDVSKTIQSVALAPKGNFMVSCTNETEIKLFDFPPSKPGQAVAVINTNQTKNHQLKLSREYGYEVMRL